MSSWLDRVLPTIQSKVKRGGVREGLWTKCPACEQVLYEPELQRNLNVCPKCDHHMRLGGRARLEAFLDKGTGVEILPDLVTDDVLKFKDSKRYKDRLVAAQKATGEEDVMVAMSGELKGLSINACAFNSNMGGSMGRAVGQFVAAAEQSLESGAPAGLFGFQAVVLVCREALFDA